MKKAIVLITISLIFNGAQLQSCQAGKPCEFSKDESKQLEDSIATAKKIIESEEFSKLDNQELAVITDIFERIKNSFENDEQMDNVTAEMIEQYANEWADVYNWIKKIMDLSKGNNPQLDKKYFSSVFDLLFSKYENRVNGGG